MENTIIKNKFIQINKAYCWTAPYHCDSMMQVSTTWNGLKIGVLFFLSKYCIRHAFYIYFLFWTIAVYTESKEKAHKRELP